MRTPVMLLPRLGSWSNALARRGPKSRNQLTGEQWHRRRDQSLYKGSVGYDVRSLPPYSLALRDTVGVECGLDGTGRVPTTDAGRAPWAVELAPLVPGQG